MDSHSCDRQGARVCRPRGSALAAHWTLRLLFTAALFFPLLAAPFRAGQRASRATNQAWTLDAQQGAESITLSLNHRRDQPHTVVTAASNHPKSPGADVLQNYGRLPLSFERNQGQADPRVEFLSHGRGYTLFLTGNEADVVLQGSKSKEKIKNQQSRIEDESIVRMRLVGANPTATVTGAEELPGKINYLIGQDPKSWRTNIPAYRRVRVENAYPCVDVVYYGNQGLLEYDFVVAPGADPSVIRLALDSGLTASTLRIAAGGDLIVKMKAGEVRFHKPVVYQPESPVNATGSRTVLPARYVLLGHNKIGFRLGSYDRRRPLIIDPALGYSTFLGGSSYDQANAVAVDVSGDTYIAGSTESTNFPVTAGAAQGASGGASDAFVTKLNASGSAVIYSTYLGGAGSDSAQGIALDSAGDAFVTGHTSSTNFPVTSGAFQTKCGDCTTGAGAFVAKLNPAGSGLLYSTYLSGDAKDYGYGIALDSAGNAYVTGYTASSNFPVTAGVVQTTFTGLQDAFVAKLNPAGSALVYSTFLGGINSQEGRAIALDTSGDAYVGGFTSSTNFPSTPASFQPTCGAACGTNDGFVSELDPAGAKLIYSTYLGGSLGASVYGLALDASNNAYLTGTTPSTDFPATKGAFQTTCGGGCTGNTVDAFAAKLKPDGSGLVYASYIGGSSNDQGNGIVVDSSGNIYVTGITFSADFPNTAGSYRTSCGAGCAAGDAFMTELDPTGSSAIYSTFLGGSSADDGTGIAIDSSGNPYVVGYTYSSDFPVTPGALQTVCGGCTTADDAFVTKFVPGVAPAPEIINFGNQAVNVASAAQTVTLSNSSAAALSITSIAITGTNAADFSETNTCGSSLAVGATCTISVIFTPASAAAFSANLTITDDASNSPQTVALSGTGVLPTASLAPTSLNFTAQQVNTASAAQTITLFNNGATSLGVTSIAVSGPGATSFSETNTCGTVGVGDSCAIYVTFKPTVAGTLSATLTTTDSAGTQTAALSGTGIAAAVSLSTASLGFGNEGIGVPSKAQTVTVTNKGNANLTITAVSFTGTNPLAFTETNTCAAAVAPNATCAISVTFDPKGAGARTATLNITDNAIGSPQTVALTGTGVGAQITLAPASLGFAGQVVGSASPVTKVTLTNTGNVALTISGMAVSGADAGDFTETNTCGTGVAVGASCTISLTFKPAGPGARTGTLTITSNGTGQTTLALSGTGEDFTAAATPGTASVSPGSSAKYTLTLTPQGGFNQTVQVTCAGAPSASTCTPSQASVPLNGSGPANVTVTVSTTAASYTPLTRNIPRLPQSGGPFTTPALWLAIPAFLGMLGFGRRRRAGTMLALMSLLVVLWASCGGGGSSGGSSGNPGTPAGSYSLVLSATGGNITQTAKVSLTVQ